jgi:hypothetical protein
MPRRELLTDSQRRWLDAHASDERAHGLDGLAGSQIERSVVADGSHAVAAPWDAAFFTNESFNQGAVMKSGLASNHIPYPTSHMEGLFSGLRAEIEPLRGFVRKRTVEITVPINGMTHTRMLDTVSLLFARYDPALALFLGYPTRRLSVTLIKAAADASAAVARLAQNPPAAERQECTACCERIQSGIADWRLSVDLKRAEHDLDVGAPETVH